jgi:hypothetical protein
VLPEPDLVRRGGWLSGAELAACAVRAVSRATKTASAAQPDRRAPATWRSQYDATANPPSPPKKKTESRWPQVELPLSI